MAIGQSKLHEMLRKHRQLSEAVAWLEAFTPQMKREILDWIRKDQLTDKGIDSDGRVIGYYSYVTEIISRGRKQQGAHYTLDDTGALYRSMYVTVLREAIEINADDGKIKDQEWYTTKIIGLTDENTQKLIAEVKKRYIAIFRKVLFGNR
jgi:hypothetical protein